MYTHKFQKENTLPGDGNEEPLLPEPFRILRRSVLLLEPGDRALPADQVPDLGLILPTSLRELLEP